MFFMSPSVFHQIFLLKDAVQPRHKGLGVVFRMAEKSIFLGKLVYFSFQYFDCGCISHDFNQTATDGYCSNVQCKFGGYPFFAAITFFTVCGMFLVVIPSIQATIRVVPFSQRSFALGIQVYICWRIEYFTHFPFNIKSS